MGSYSGWIKASAVVPFTAATLPNKPTKAVSPDQDTPYFGSRLYKKDKDYRAAVLEAVRLGIANGDPFPHEIVDMVANADEVQQ